MELCEWQETGLRATTSRSVQEPGPGARFFTTAAASAQVPFALSRAAKGGGGAGGRDDDGT